jgi:hypothetical protein
MKQSIPRTPCDVILWKILIMTSTAQMRILDQGRTVTAPVDYWGILEMLKGTSGLPFASTLKCIFCPDNVVIQITEPLASAAS